MRKKRATVPSGDRDALAFTRVRAQAWREQAAVLGIDPARADELIAASDAAAQALKARVAAEAAAEAATIAWHAAAARNRALAQDLVRTIRYTATSGDDPDTIYAAALIDPPGDRRELPEPEVPKKLKITSDSEGRAVLRFDGCRHGGTVWTIERRVADADGQLGPWEQAATVLRREFVDQATPSGVQGVQYRVQAVRRAGASAFSSPVVLPMGVRPARGGTAGAIARAKPVGSRAG